jgi:crotonobetainyl-CoA:carnitine CoA-transferase CaiB-like acyl-CoA transferase
MMLADMGADVLLVASPTDPMGTGMSVLARNKRSMTLNLKAPEGRDVFAKLARNADVVLEGFRPGVVTRLGVDFETLRKDNPRLVYCSLSGYGQTGPYRDLVGHDVNYLGYAGVVGLTGNQAGPSLAGVQIADVGGGALMAAVGILTALVARGRTGEGQLVDISMLDGSIAWNAFHWLVYFSSGQVPRRGETTLTGATPSYAIYECRDGKYLTIGALEGHFWKALCGKLGRPEYVAQQFPAANEREEVFAFFRAKFKERTRDEWLREFEGTDICVGPVNDLAETERDPQVRAREMIVEIDTPSGKQKTLGIPIKLSATPGTVRTPPPAFGQHTDQVLGGLGYSAQDIERLRSAGIV